MTTPPDWQALEDLIVAESLTAIELLAEEHGNAEFACFVLWADPYNGCYEFLADTAERNATGATARNARLLTYQKAWSLDGDDWKTLQSAARRMGPLSYDPTWGDYELAEDPIHSFDLSYEEFLDSSEYTELNQGGEDGWLEGHVRIVLARALLRLIDDGAFAPLKHSRPLHVGYAYNDSGEALMVGVVPA